MTPAYANGPWEFSRRDWWQIAKRWFVQINADNVSVAAAGVAFFSLVALFPLISAALSLYGYFADPRSVEPLLNEVTEFLPEESRQVLVDQVNAVLGAKRDALGIGFLVSLALAVYSAGAGIRALMRGLNIAYGEVERRPIWKFYLTALAFTVMMGVFFGLAFMAVVVIPIAVGFIPYMDRATAQLAKGLPFVGVVLVFFWACFTLYRFGPDRKPAKKRWTWPGALFATVFWLAGSWAFARFVANFGNYNATYGSIASVMILLLWLFLTAFVVLMGAELNAEMERQTLVDTTRGPAKPLGVRGANMADFLPDPLMPKDVEVDVVMPVVRARHIRSTDTPPEKVEEEVVHDGAEIEAPKDPEAVRTGGEV